MPNMNSISSKAMLVKMLAEKNRYNENSSIKLSSFDSLFDEVIWKNYYWFVFLGFLKTCNVILKYKNTGNLMQC
jgi:hypothetical protein